MATTAQNAQTWRIQNGRWQYMADNGWADYGDANNAQSRVINGRTQYYNPVMGNWVISNEKLTPTAQQQSAAQQAQTYYTPSAATMSSGSGIVGGSGGGTTTSSGLQPEQVALQQIAQIDPTGSALRDQMGQSYLNLLRNPVQTPTARQLTGPSLENAPTKGAPSAADLQSYLNLYKQIDPTGLAGRRQLEQQLTSQAALGSQLDPETAREIEQQTRLGQAARGNVYGTPQLVQEAMTRGEAGLALQQQRQQALQGFYQSGQDVGNVANQLYQQGQQNYLNQLQGYLNNYSAYQNAWQANQNNQLNYWNAQQQAQANNRGQALSYLTSGATPYQMGSNYLTNTENRAANAAGGGVTYNPASLGQTYTGQGAGYFPDYGLNTSQNAQGWFNSLSAYNNPYGSRGGGAGGAALGALGGAASGALTGSAAGPWGTLIGAGVGALAGGVKGYSG